MPNAVASLPVSSLLILVGTVLSLGACAEAGGRTQPPPDDKIQSVTLDARRAPAPSMLVNLRDMGVTHVTLVQFGFQPGHDVPEIRMHTDADWFSESDRGIRILAAQADTLGLGIILKPHIWMGRYSADGQARDAIGFETEEGWLAWEAQYRTFMMHYAYLAEEIDAAMLVVGTELANAVRTRPAFWRSLIAEVRTVYGGPLTYAANWWEEYEAVTFWDALDYIGVQAYFELSKEDNPTAAMLHEGWKPYKETLQALSEYTGRPVLFTEIGYRNVPDAAAKPWRWPTREDLDHFAPDDALQVRLYQVFFESLWHESWFSGAILWKWKPEAGRRRNYLDFSPQNKPAEGIIAQWFRRNRPGLPVASPR